METARVVGPRAEVVARVVVEGKVEGILAGVGMGYVVAFGSVCLEGIDLAGYNNVDQGRKMAGCRKAIDSLEVGYIVAAHTVIAGYTYCLASTVEVQIGFPRWKQRDPLSQLWGTLRFHPFSLP